MHFFRLVHLLSLCFLLKVAHEGLRRCGDCLFHQSELFSCRFSEVFVGSWVSQGLSQGFPVLLEDREEDWSHNIWLVLV